MKKSKCFSACRPRSLWIASFLVVAFSFGASAAVGEKDGGAVQGSFEKAERGFGELLKGMGQEIGKAIGSDDAKKDKKRETKHADDKSDKGKESK